MATEQYSIGYEEGFQDGWNAAVDSLSAQRKPLTDEEMADFLGDRYHSMTENELEFFRLGEADPNPNCPLLDTPPAQQEPIYQLKKTDGSWIDQAKHSYDYNVQHGGATVRVVYLAPQPAQRKPLTDMQVDGEWILVRDLDTNDVEKSRLFARAIEAAHGIKENT